MKKVISIFLTVFLVSTNFQGWNFLKEINLFENFDLCQGLEKSFALDKVTEEGFYYKISDGKVIITGVQNRESKNVVIPDEIEGYPVTEIEVEVFYDDKTIESIKLPKYFESLSYTDAEVPARIFRECENLKSIEISEDNAKFKTVDGVLYSNDTILIYPGGKEDKSFEIPNGVKYIEEDAFYGAKNLEEIKIPDSVKQIGNYAFAGCKSLTNLVLPGGAKLQIDGGIISGCSNLESIEIQGDNEDFATQDGILYNKDKSKLIICPDGRKDDVDILDTVTRIEDFAFAGCTYIKNVQIPNSVKSIGVDAFYECNSLERITIPRSVDCIEDSAISEKSGIKEIWVYKDSYAHKYFRNDERFRLIKDDSPLSTPRIRVASNGNTSIRVSLVDRIDDADGYEIYRATSENGKYYLRKTCDSNFSYINTGLTTGKTYYYKVRAYKVVNGKRVYGKFSYIVPATPKLQAPTINVKSGTKKVTVSWNKVSGAYGYKVYRATSKNGTYYLKKTVTSGSTTSYTNTGLTKGKTYYYKVKAYRVVDGKRVYSDYSSVKYIKCK